MKILKGNVFPWILDVYNVLKYTWFILLFLMLGKFLLVNVDQANDIFISLIKDQNKGRERMVLYLITLLWGLSSWYCSRLILEKTDIHSSDSEFSNRLQKWFPRVFAAMPFYNLALAFSEPHRIEENKYYFFKNNFGVLSVVVGIVFFILVSILENRRSEFNTKSIPVTAGQKKIIISFLVFSVFLTIIFGIKGSGSQLALFLGPASVMILAFAVYTALGTLLVWADFHYKFPFTLASVGLVVLFSYFNNNHQIRTVNDFIYSSKSQNKLTHLDNYFLQWFKKHNHDTSSSGPIPVFLVAAEGGGIRSAYWTATVMAKLEKEFPGFYNHVFAVSGVSGGSVGLSVFNALYSDYLNNKVPHDSLLVKSRNILKRDFLSPLNSAFMFPDMLQKIIFFPVRAFDRAMWLEDACSEAYTAEVGTSTMDIPLCDLWTEKNQKPCPAYFFNASKVETGQKAILSNIYLDTNYFRGIVDVQEDAGKCIALKTAAFMSARFPLVTPAATIEKQNGNKFEDAYNIVDGGYIENTGLETIQSVFDAIYKFKRNPEYLKEFPQLKNLVVHMIFIKNNQDTDFESAKAISGIYETRAVIQTFFNAWSNSSDATIHNIDNALNNMSPESKFITFSLDRTKGTMPLGWFLSEDTRLRIDTLVNSVDSIKNGKSYHELIKIINRK